MPINRFETVLQDKGQVDAYYKYNDKDEVISIGVNISSYAQWEFTQQDYDELLTKAILHHKAVADERKHRVSYS